LDDIRQQAADSIICLGDVASLGPCPKEVLNIIKELGCPCIFGNHEAAMLEPEKAGQYHIAPHLIPTLEWEIAELDSEDWDFIHTFHKTLEVPLDGKYSMLCYHGSPKSNVDNLLPETPLDQLGKYIEGQTARVMAGGHTHFQMLRQYEGKL